MDSLCLSVLLLISGVIAAPTEAQNENQNEDTQGSPISLKSLFENTSEPESNLTDPTTSPLTPANKKIDVANTTLKSLPVNTNLSQNNSIPQRENGPCLMRRSSRRRPVHPDYPSLVWLRFSGLLPRFTVRVLNTRENRSDYICAPLTGCYWASGFYNPERGPYCYSPCHGEEQKSSRFDLLVNKDNLVSLVWRAGSSAWSHPNAVRVWESNAIGRSQHGLGTVYLPFSQFYVPWKGKELVLVTGYEVLVIVGEFTERIFDVIYDFDGMVRDTEPTVNIGLTLVTNNNCVTVKKTMRLSESTQRQNTWETTQSDLFGSATKVSLSVKIPILPSLNLGLEETFTFERTFTNKESRSVTQTIMHALTVEVEVPPNHTCRVNMVGRGYKVNIPYTATVRRVYENGEEETLKVPGVYQGAQVGEINAIAERCQPINDPEPCHNS
ncbi:natterin-3-like [Hoplias malabaricus]|uniref:natterin-3-like n=1 Tax=Hoplias malabaricus TaxID=27720 RepID=UPI0034618A51